MTVEAVGNLADLGCGFLWVAMAQVLIHHVFTVANDMVCKQIQKIRKQIQDPQGEPGEQSKH